MSLEKNLEEIKIAIDKGERVRILYQLILEQLGLTMEVEGHKVFKALGENQDKYFEAIKSLNEIMKMGTKPVNTEEE